MDEGNLQLLHFLQQLNSPYTVIGESHDDTYCNNTY